MIATTNNNSPSAKGEYPEGWRSFLPPKLRFPEFQNEDAWQVKPLNELLFETKKRNKNLEFGPTDVLSVSGEYGCVNQIELMGRSYAGVSVKNYRVVEHGDIVYTKSPLKKNPFGIIKENKGKRGIVSTLYAVYRPFPSCSGTYLDQFFSGDYNLNAYLQPLVKKGAKNDMKVNNTDVLKGAICVPAFAEQQKIADCLSSLDELIAAQACKVEALKVHKKGLMERLFTCEGEALPRLRSPEFLGLGEWEKRKAGSLFFHRTAKGDYGLPIYSVTMNDGMVRRDSLDRKVDDIEDAVRNKKVLCNDIAYNMMRMWQGAMGVAPEDCLVSPAYVVLAPKKDAVPYFFQYLFKLPEILQMLTAHSRGLTKDRLRLYFDDFAKMEFRCPAVQEQQRIADFLGSIDKHIAIQAERLDKLKAHKRGLMQQLFPAAEALEA